MEAGSFELLWMSQEYVDKGLRPLPKMVVSGRASWSLRATAEPVVGRPVRCRCSAEASRVPKHSRSAQRSGHLFSGRDRRFRRRALSGGHAWKERELGSQPAGSWRAGGSASWPSRERASRGSGRRPQGADPEAVSAGRAGRSGAYTGRLDGSPRRLRANRAGLSRVPHPFRGALTITTITTRDFFADEFAVQPTRAADAVQSGCVRLPRPQRAAGARRVMACLRLWRPAPHCPGTPDATSAAVCDHVQAMGRG